MGIDFVINMVVSQVGEERSKELLSVLKNMASNMGDDTIYILTKVPNKGICFISTTKQNTPLSFQEKPSITEVEKIVNDIEI